MRVFVAGATGFTGREVVRQCAARGHEVVAHIRPGSRALGTWGPTFREWGASIDSSPWTDAEITAALSAARPQLVFSLIGTTRKRAAQDGMKAGEAYERVNYGLTAMMIRAAATVEPAPRFVYLSSAGVSPATKNPYLAARARAEAELRNAGLPFVIARPSFITGDRDESRPGEHIGAAIGNSLLAMASAFGARTLRARYRSMDNRELASALIAAGCDDTYTGRVLAGEDLRPLIAPT